MHRKGGAWKAGIFAGRASAKGVEAEASTELWIPSSVPAAYGPWSGQRNLLPSAWSMIRNREVADWRMGDGFLVVALVARIESG